MENELIILVIVDAGAANLSVITTDMLYTMAALQAPRAMTRSGDENRQIRWRGKRGMDGWSDEEKRRVVRGKTGAGAQ